MNPPTYPPAPLTGIRVVHVASLGPGPFAAMLLADLGADVTIIDRVVRQEVTVPPADDPRRRGQRSIALDLKQPVGVGIAFRLIEQADVLIEGMRPAVADRIGIGPEQCLARNPALVYARMTGWGQTGPLADTVGHDINYLGLTGALHALGDADRPPRPPLNLLGDYGGGGMYLVMGVLAALLERAATGRGRVVDAAILDGVGLLAAATYGLLGSGQWGPRSTNVFDGSRAWYRTYRTLDGEFVAVGALEPRFYSNLLVAFGLDPAEWPQHDLRRGDELAEVLTARFATDTRDHWCERLAELDACVSPVLSFAEAAHHPHNASRGTHLTLDSISQPAPGPLFDGARPVVSSGPATAGRDTMEIMREAGYEASEIEDALRRAAAACPA